MHCPISHFRVNKLPIKMQLINCKLETTYYIVLILLNYCNYDNNCCCWLEYVLRK